MTTDRLVSVIVSTYYRNETLQEAIDSALDQSYEPIEILVVDDSGEAHAQPIIDQYDNDQLEYIPLEKNRGPHRARKIGIKNSTGAYIQFLDDDDRLLDEKVTKQVDLLDDDPNTGVVYCGHVWEEGLTILPDQRVTDSILKYALMFRTSPCNIGTMLMERDTLERVLPLKNFHGADDIGMQIELAQVAEFEHIDEVLFYRGDSNGSRGTTQAAVEGRHQLLEQYADLYKEFQPGVRRAALAETHLIQGQIQIQERLWSPAAITSFARAAHLYPGMEVPYVGAFVAALFGRPGYRTARRLYSKYVLGSERRGKQF